MNELTLIDVYCHYYSIIKLVCSLFFIIVQICCISSTPNFFKKLLEMRFLNACNFKTCLSMTSGLVVNALKHPYKINTRRPVLYIKKNKIKNNFKFSGPSCGKAILVIKTCSSTTF